MALKKNLPERVTGTFCQPELAYTNGGKPYTKFTIAKPNPKGRPQNGQQPEYGTPIWFNCTFWGDEFHSAEDIAQIPDKSVYMTVEVTTKQFDGKDGKPIQNKHVDAILGIRQKEQRQQGQQQNQGYNQGQQKNQQQGQQAQKQYSTPARSQGNSDFDDDYVF